MVIKSFKAQTKIKFKLLVGKGKKDRELLTFMHKLNNKVTKKGEIK